MIINEKFYVVMMLADWWKYSNFAELLKISILKTNINVSLITDSHISNRRPLPRQGGDSGKLLF
jgi:hypothetical protein